MQVQKISNSNQEINFQHKVNKKAPFFGPVKNTFERQISIAKADHLEAKARLHYMKYLKFDEELDNFDNPFSSIKETWRLLKTFLSMTYHKLKSSNYSAESNHYRHKYDKKLINEYKHSLKKSL